MSHFLVTYVMYHPTTPEIYTDHYEVFENLPEAHKRYNELVNRSTTWTCNVSRVIRSTDLEMPVTQWNLETKPIKKKEWRERGIRSPNQKEVSCEL